MYRRRRNEDSSKGWTSNGVWDREASSSDYDQLGERVFVVMLTLWTAFGIGVSAWTSYICRSMVFSTLEVIGLVVLTFVGVLVSAATRHALMSLLGYMMIAIPFGMLLGPVLALYTTASLFKVFCLTGGITVLFGLIGAFIPSSLKGWGVWLMGGLMVLIFGMSFTTIAAYFGLPVEGTLKAWDWFAVVLFVGLIAFDFNRAMRVKRTMTNAIDCAVAIYLDFLNLFLHLLSLAGKRD